MVPLLLPAACVLPRVPSGSTAPVARSQACQRAFASDRGRAAGPAGCPGARGRALDDPWTTPVARRPRRSTVRRRRPAAGRRPAPAGRAALGTAAPAPAGCARRRRGPRGAGRRAADGSALRRAPARDGQDAGRARGRPPPGPARARARAEHGRAGAVAADVGRLRRHAGPPRCRARHVRRPARGRHRPDLPGAQRLGPRRRRRGRRRRHRRRARRAAPGRRARDRRAPTCCRCCTRAGRELVDRAAALGPWTLVVDECAHLLETWGSLRARARRGARRRHRRRRPVRHPGRRARRARPRGARPRCSPDPTSRSPCPMAVARGEVAPCATCVHVTRPTPEEDAALAGDRGRFGELRDELLRARAGSLPFADWLWRRLHERRVRRRAAVLARAASRPSRRSRAPACARCTPGWSSLPPGARPARGAPRARRTRRTGRCCSARTPSEHLRASASAAGRPPARRASPACCPSLGCDAHRPRPARDDLAVRPGLRACRPARPSAPAGCWRRSSRSGAPTCGRWSSATSSSRAEVGRPRGATAPPRRRARPARSSSSPGRRRAGAAPAPGPVHRPHARRCAATTSPTCAPSPRTGSPTGWSPSRTPASARWCASPPGEEWRGRDVGAARARTGSASGGTRAVVGTRGLLGEGWDCPVAQRRRRPHRDGRPGRRHGSCADACCAATRRGPSEVVHAWTVDLRRRRAPARRRRPPARARAPGRAALGADRRRARRGRRRAPRRGARARTPRPAPRPATRSTRGPWPAPPTPDAPARAGPRRDAAAGGAERRSCGCAPARRSGLPSGVVPPALLQVTRTLGSPAPGAAAPHAAARAAVAAAGGGGASLTSAAGTALESALVGAGGGLAHRGRCSAARVAGQRWATQSTGAAPRARRTPSTAVLRALGRRGRRRAARRAAARPSAPRRCASRRRGRRRGRAAARRPAGRQPRLFAACLDELLAAARRAALARVPARPAGPRTARRPRAGSRSPARSAGRSTRPSPGTPCRAADPHAGAGRRLRHGVAGATSAPAGWCSPPTRRAASLVELLRGEDPFGLDDAGAHRLGAARGSAR